MHTPSLLVAAVACLSTLAAAEFDQPKFYFPRQVKRQIWNNLTGPLTTPARSLTLPRQDSSTTKRQTSPLSDPNGISSPNSAAGTGVTTVVIESTTVVIDSGPPATNTPSMPTTVGSSGPATTSSDNTITFVPSGVITPSTAAATSSNPVTTDSPAPAAATTTSASASSSAAPLVDSLLSSVVSVVSSVVSPILAAPTTSSTDVASAAPTRTKGITGPGTSATPTPTQNVLSSIISDVSVPVSTALASSASTTTDVGILSSIASILNTATGSVTLSVVTPTSPTDTSGISFTAVPTGGSSGIGSIITSALAPTTTGSVIIGGITTSDNNTSLVLPTSIGSQAVITDTGVTATPTASLGGTLTTGGAGNLTDSATATQPPASVSATAITPLTSILPTGTATDAATTAWLPATIVVQSSPIASDAIATTATGIATTLPQAISPPTGIPQVPQDSTLIQVGFNYSLNYAFVVANPNSSAQIFAYLPQGLAHGLSINLGQVTMHSLNPYDTQNTLGFITTLATAWIPSNMVDTLQQSLHQQLSKLYQNSDQSVYQLMQYINPTIPLIPGGSMVDGSAAATGTGAPTSATSSTGGNGVFNTDSQNSSPATKSTTVGIAMAAIGGAAAYGAAMFFIARRYKKRRSLHRRTSSVASHSQMRFTGSPALMGGAVMSGGRGTPGLQNGRESRGSGRSAGNSARTVEISAPMMAENSLGWN